MYKAILFLTVIFVGLTARAEILNHDYNQLQTRFQIPSDATKVVVDSAQEKTIATSFDYEIVSGCTTTVEGGPMECENILREYKEQVMTFRVPYKSNEGMLDDMPRANELSVNIPIIKFDLQKLIDFKLKRIKASDLAKVDVEVITYPKEVIDYANSHFCDDGYMDEYYPCDHSTDVIVTKIIQVTEKYATVSVK